MQYYSLYKKYKCKYLNILKHQQSAGKLNSHQEIFENIYDKRIWAPNANTPLSGAGSSNNYNKVYMSFLQNFIDDKKHNIKRILDLGCGDWTFTKNIDFTGREYLGLDVVSSVINKNIKKYQTNNIRFKQVDITNTSKLKKYLDYDLFIFKDILQHWSDQDITKVLDFLVKHKKPKYILIVNGKNNFKHQTRDVNNYYHYSNLNFKYPPLKKYRIKHLFNYKFKEVGLIEN